MSEKNSVTVDQRVLRRAIAANYLATHAGDLKVNSTVAEEFADRVLSSLNRYAEEVGVEDHDASDGLDQ